ncbi:sigma-70 family RNA polymerase sigma factor [Pseudonocardia spinosispora]|uniref:sigma-70 family RNA polymerase sigma factor n=1 Tax=Pseudonocardia spinosispora TaxID=103441 RepID=UPI000402429E|nr:sigma-70 family RNA polymerase sigma factor [Pseudonocardia spinosispora]
MGLRLAAGVVIADLEQLRPELTGYCYRMLGSTFDAEDAVQETFMRAWRAADGFEGRSELRTWVFSIATNVCLTHLRRAARRALPMDVGAQSNDSPILGAPLSRQAWVEPIPGARVERDPSEQVVERDSIRLAFIAALQLLTPRQRAVLVLRDVLQWKIREVAQLLGTTEDAVNAVLRRARTALAAWEPSRTVEQPDRELLRRYVEAFEGFDIDGLVALLHEEATLSMPPYALWLRGPDAIGDWFRRSSCQDSRLVAVDANGTAGFGVYRRDGETYRPFAVQIVETDASRITALHTFIDPALFPFFDLPPVKYP